MTYLIPEQIESERLILRLPQISDWQPLHRYYADEQLARYTTGQPLTEGQSWRTVAAMIGHWQIHGYGPYTLEEKANGEVIGVSGLWFPGDWPMPEIKWGLVAEKQGQGFASEAARATWRAAAQYLPDLHLISLIHSDNAPSIQLAKAVGAVFESAIDFRDSEFHIYRHPAPA